MKAKKSAHFKYQIWLLSPRKSERLQLARPYRVTCPCDWLNRFRQGYWLAAGTPDSVGSRTIRVISLEDFFKKCESTRLWYPTFPGRHLKELSNCLLQSISSQKLSWRLEVSSQVEDFWNLCSDSLTSLSSRRNPMAASSLSSNGALCYNGSRTKSHQQTNKTKTKQNQTKEHNVHSNKIRHARFVVTNGTTQLRKKHKKETSAISHKGPTLLGNI